MSRRSAARIGWTLCGVSIALVAISLVFSVINRSVPGQGDFSATFDAISTIGLLSFPVVGALIMSSQPANSIGWLFCAVGLPFGASGVAYGWGAYGLLENPGGLPGAEVAASFADWLFVPPLFAIPSLLFLLFPDGRPPTRRWRPVAWLAVGGAAATAVGTALSPGRLDEPPFQRVVNPLGVEPAGSFLEGVAVAGFITLFFAILLGVAALLVRYRRARGDERQQLKWFAGASALFALACLANLLPFSPLPSDSYGQLLILFAFAFIPVAAGVAILKHRLYDIDVVINRTLVYGALTATLVGAYLASVLLLQLVLSPESDIAIAASTLAVAALFRPARGRIQQLVNRRFYRSRYDATRTLEGFGARLRDEVDLEAVNGELASVVRETMQPAHVSLWLRAPETRT